MNRTATPTDAESRTRKAIDRRSMPQIKSKDGLKAFLLTSRLLSLDDWNSLISQLPDSTSIESMLQIL